MHCREGVTWGDPLSMVAYGIGIIPLIKQPKAGFPGVTQPRYADDSSTLSTFVNAELYFNLLK